MNLYKKSVIAAFFATLLLTLLWTIFFPALKIYFFVSLIIILLYQKSLLFCLWSSTLLGLFLDILSPNFKFGLNAVAFSVTAFIMYRQKRNFFADNLTTLPLMTFFFSMLSTLIRVSIQLLFDKKLRFGATAIFSDLIAMPLLDALFAFLYFILPFFLFGKPIKKGEDYFLHAK